MTTPQTALETLEAAVAEGQALPVQGDERPGMPSEKPPRLDPDDPRASLAELRALEGQLPEPPTLDAKALRMGWIVDSGEVEQEARAWPMLAKALHEGATLASDWLDDLALMDAALADPASQPGRSSSESLVQRWLRSPGRRLVTDLSLLDRLRDDEPLAGATELTWGALTSAAGASRGAKGACAEWRALHTMLPGAAGDPEWAPEVKDTANGPDAAEALFLLEQGETAFGRGAALAWLLNRAATAPVVQIAGLRRDVREELPTRLALLLSQDTHQERHLRTMAELEHISLRHAALIANKRHPDAPIAEIWHVARWIQGIVLRSPFFGGEPEGVSARLRARLPKDPPEVTPQLPALHPARFAREAAEGLPLGDMGVLIGLIRHLVTTNKLHDRLPGPLLEWLVKLAGRPCTKPEWAAERAPRRDGWPHPHVAPPLLARWILTQIARVPWLGAANEKAQEEAVEALGEMTEEKPWPALSIEREGGALKDSVALLAVKAWREGIGKNAPAWAVSSVGLGLVNRLEPQDWERLLDQICAVAGEWRVKLLPRFIERARALSHEQDRSPLVERAVVALAELTNDSANVGDLVRLEAAARTIEQVRGRAVPGAERALAILHAASRRPPLNGQPSLLAALRRLEPSHPGA
jgi:hypothetical protein